MFVIRKLTDNDFPEIKRIFIQTFPRTDDTDFAVAWRTKECNYSLGLFHKATLVGFAITCLEEDGAAARLWFIAVDPAQRSCGAGTQLLNALIARVKVDGKRLVLTPDNSERVISWYERHGFVITRHLPFIHKDIPTCWMKWQGDLPADLQVDPQSPASTKTLSSGSGRASSGRSSFSCDDMQPLEI